MISVHKFEELVYLKDSDILFQTIEKVKSAISGLNCNPNVLDYFKIDNNTVSFDITISFPLPHRSDLNFNSITEPGEDIV